MHLVMQLGAGAQIPIRRNDTRVSKKKIRRGRKIIFRHLLHWALLSTLCKNVLYKAITLHKVIVRSTSGFLSAFGFFSVPKFRKPHDHISL